VPAPLGAALAAAAEDAARPAGPRPGAALAARHPCLRPLAAIVAQSDELGTPLAPALRLLAADERARRRALARERAAAAAPRMMLVVGLVLAPAALLLIVGAQALVLVDALRSGRP
jgi:tight adherence protein C